MACTKECATAIEAANNARRDWEDSYIQLKEKYEELTKLFEELWGSGVTDCGPNDYKTITEHIMDKLTKTSPTAAEGERLPQFTAKDYAKAADYAEAQQPMATTNVMGPDSGRGGLNEALNRADRGSVQTKERYKGAISIPCSACSAGDTKMEHHDHDYVQLKYRVTDK